MLEELAPNLFLQRHALKLAGCNMGRVVSIIRLESGESVVHSTANFQPEHISEILKLGEVGWLVEATNFHDTFAGVGRASFPDSPYLTPPGFRCAETLGATPLSHPPSEWAGDLELIEVRGMPKIQERVMFHRASKTLIVADLLFNLQAEAGRWTLGFMRAMAGIREYPGMSRLFRFCIKDRSAFAASMREIATLDFERIVVAHGEPIVEDAKRQFLSLMATHGFDIGAD